MSKLFFVVISEDDMKNLIGINETAEFESQYPHLVKTVSQRFPETYNVTCGDLPPVTVLDIDL